MKPPFITVKIQTPCIERAYIRTPLSKTPFATDDAGIEAASALRALLAAPGAAGEARGPAAAHPARGPGDHAHHAARRALRRRAALQGARRNVKRPSIRTPLLKRPYILSVDALL